MIVFSKKWFEKHQSKLLFFLNAPILKYWFRYVLRIHKDLKSDETICEINPNNYKVYLGMFLENKKLVHRYRADFRTHDKFSKRLYFAFKPIWFVMHGMDWAFLDRMDALAKLSFGFDTLTQYPGSTGTNNPVDGYAARLNVADQILTDIRAGAGTNVDTATVSSGPFLRGGNSSPKFTSLGRFLACFDTSSIGASSNISDTVLSLYGTQKHNDLGGSPEIAIGQGDTASDTALATGDYSQSNHGTTAFSSNITYASFTVGAYNAFTFNATGKNAISKDGITKISVQSNWDMDNNFDGTWASLTNFLMRFSTAKEGGTTQDPKLVITYSEGADTNSIFFGCNL